jgi:hypothetical protein
MELKMTKIVSTVAALLFMALSPSIFVLSNTLPALQRPPMTKAEVLERLQSATRREIQQGDIAGEIEERGINFEVTDEVLGQFRRAGAKSFVVDALLRAITRKNNPQPASPPSERKPERPSDPGPNTAAGDDDANDEARAFASLPLIEQARRFALNYTQELPNFVVDQQVKRLTQDPYNRQWRLKDTLDIEVTYESSTGENYRLQAIDGRPTRKSYDDVGGASSAGEFGTILIALFNPRSNAQFKQGPVERINGRPAVVFDFHVPTATSSNHITDTRSGKTIISGYRGSVWIDQETKRVLRIEQSSNDIPSGFPITIVESAVDYDWFEITGKRFLLPKRAELIIGSDIDRLYSRNVIEFRNYRKFEVDVRIDGADD